MAPTKHEQADGITGGKSRAWLYPITPETKPKALVLHVAHAPTGGWAVVVYGTRKALRKFVSASEALRWIKRRKWPGPLRVFQHMDDGTVKQVIE